MNHNRENNQNMGENSQHGQGFQNNRNAPASPSRNNTNQGRNHNRRRDYNRLRNRNRQRNRRRRRNQNQHMFDTLMQNENTRPRLDEMYQELMEQQSVTMPVQNNDQTAQLANIQNSLRSLQLGQFDSVVPFEKSLDSMGVRTNFHQHYLIKEKIGEGGQGSVYSGKQWLH